MDLSKSSEPRSHSHPLLSSYCPVFLLLTPSSPKFPLLPLLHLLVTPPPNLFLLPLHCVETILAHITRDRHLAKSPGYFPVLSFSVVSWILWTAPPFPLGTIYLLSGQLTVWFLSLHLSPVSLDDSFFLCLPNTGIPQSSHK